MRENDSSLPETSLFSAINRGEVHSAEMYFSTFRLIRKIRFITLVCPFPPFALYYCLDKLYFVHTEAQRKLSLNSNYLPESSTECPVTEMGTRDLQSYSYSL